MNADNKDSGQDGDKDGAIALQGSVWLTVDGENLGGAGRVALLGAIAEYGSITQAAKAVKMSYKAAWDAIDAMNNLAGVALVERVAGGKGGGGTRLTRRGVQLVENFKIIEREHQLFVRQLARQAEGLADDLVLIRRIGLKTSARNQFLGRVSQVWPGSVNDDIELALAGGQRIVATVTHDSAVGLGLVAGVEAFALVKASAVCLLEAQPGECGDRLGDKLGDQSGGAPRNRLAGRVARLQVGVTLTEVVLELAGGASIVAVIANAERERLALAVGAAASAIFAPASVILGVPA